MDPSAVNNAIGLVQQVIKLGKQATNLQYEEALQAAREALFLQKENNLMLAEENSTLKQQLKLLQEKESLSKFVEFHRGGYWLSRNGNHEGPHCIACWTDRDKLVRLTKIRMAGIEWQCPSCKAGYGHDVKTSYEQA